jgi:hypothetical protein
MKSVVIGLLLIFGLSAHASDLQKLALQSPFVQYPVSMEKDNVPLYLKSAGKGFVFSAVLPGAGQLYAGSYLKAALFIAVEATAWYMYAHYNQEGNDLEDQFHTYADAHWSEPDYWKWISQHSGITYSEENMEALRDWEHEHFSHGLHRQKDQQYYEMIGKYDQFNAAWDDAGIGLLDQAWDTSNPDRSENRLYYEDLRDESNQAFKKATTGATIALINHIISAADASYTIYRHNQKELKTALYLQQKRINHQDFPLVTLELSW